MWAERPTPSLGAVRSVVGEPGEPLRPGEPLGPGEPLHPREPLRPGEPVRPGEPLEPGEPLHPGQPLEPGEPPHPGEPFEPGEPLFPGQPPNPRRDALVTLLEEARSLGFLGPGPIEAHLDHSLAFATLVHHLPGQAVDLGSGGGVPGLVLALIWPDSRWVLLDSGRRRTEFLQRAIDRLGVAPRVAVLCQRAEEAGRSPALRGHADLVVARSFGAPAVTAECAAPLLKPGGLLIVAEPPGGDQTRWPPSPLAAVGLRPDRVTSVPWAMQSLVQTVPCPDHYPRRTGVPAKRPLFGAGSPR